jgi:hypothetical protein
MTEHHLQSIGVRLPSSVISAVEQAAAAKGTSRTETARNAIMLGLPLLEAGINPDIKRLIFLLENLNLGMTLLLDKEHEQDISKLIRMAADNVDTYHG